MTDTDTATGDPMLDDEWLAPPARRSRLRIALVVTLAAAVCFLAGALAQKHLGAETAAETAAGPPGFAGGGLPEGLPEGIGQDGFPGGGAPSTSTGDEATADDTGESVIGEVIKVRGDVWVVEDLGGNRHEVEVSTDTDVVRETTIEPAQVEVGDPVDIAGTTSDGRLVADEVTLR